MLEIADLLRQTIQKRITKNAIESLLIGNGLANRIVNIFPNACWNTPPELLVNGEIDTIFLYKEIFYSFKQVDLFAEAFGEAIMVLIPNNSIPINQPINKLDINELAQIKVFHNYKTKLNNDNTSIDFQKPIKYIIDNVEIHHSRVILVKREGIATTTIKRSILYSIFPQLVSLVKLLKDASEIFALNSIGRIAILSKEGFLAKEEDAFKEKIKNFDAKEQKYLSLVNADIKALQFDFHNPDLLVNNLIQFIATSINVPRRILEGAEAGQLASSQDENNFQNRIQERRMQFCNKIIDDFFARFNYGNYIIHWNDNTALNNKDQSDYAMKITKAISDYIAGGLSEIMSLQQFYNDVLNLEYPKQYIDEINKGIDTELDDEQDNE